MYTKEEHAFSERCYILDPTGYIICSVEDAETADILLSHLNRG
jgi:predicted SAM-dependent methyltransferase